MDEHVAVRASAPELGIIPGLHARPTDSHERTSGLRLHHVTSFFFLLGNCKIAEHFRLVFYI